jgi:hypothetical protein
MAQTGLLTQERQTTYFENPNVDWLWCEGAELVLNGDDHIGTITWTGDDPDSWTVSEGGTADVTEDAEGIQLVAAVGADPAIISQTVSVNPAKQYILKATVETLAAATLHAYLGQAVTDIVKAGNMGLTFAGVGTQTRIGYPDQFGDSQKITVHAAEATASDGILSTISLKEVMTTLWPNGRRVNSIEFIPGANSDICIFRDGYNLYAAANKPICYYVNEATDQISARGQVDFYGQRMKLFLDVANSTLSDGCKIIIRWYE